MALTDRNVTVRGRLSFPDLFKARKANDQADPKFGATLLIPKSDTATIAAVQKAIDAAVAKGVKDGKFKNTIDPSKTKYPPLRDGDSLTDSGEPRGPEYAGHWFISAKSPESRPPMVVDKQRQPIFNEDDIYPGCYVYMALEFFPYENTGNKGIAPSLIGVMFDADGERFGDAPLEAEDVFGMVGSNGGGGNTAPSSDDDWL